MEPPKQALPRRRPPILTGKKPPPPKRSAPALPQQVLPSISELSESNDKVEEKSPVVLPTRNIEPASSKDSKSGRMKNLPPTPEKPTTEAAVWDCDPGNGLQHGIMVSLGDGVAIFLDDHLKELMSSGSDVKMNYKTIFRGDISKIVEFLPPEQSNKLVQGIDRLFHYRVKIRQNVKPHNVGKRIPVPKPTPKFAPEPLPEEEDKRAQKYSELLEKAKSMDFTEFERMNIVCMNIGRDKFNRPIVLFKERGFTKLQVDSLIYYVLQKIDPIADKEYCLIWCIHNSRKKGEKVFKPGLQWLLSVYRSLSRKVRKNLKSLYLIHPTLLYNVIIRFFRPFVSKKFWKKLHLCNSVADIEKRNELSLTQCPLPPGTCCYNIEKYREKCDLPMFCVPLEKVYLRKENFNRSVPLGLDKCLNFLENVKNYNNGGIIPIRVEGIFRKAGNKVKINDLRMAFDHGYNVDLTHCDIHSVSGLVKLWFRELVEPIVPFSLYNSFLSLHPNYLENIEKIKETIELVKEPNYSVLKRIFQFLSHVAKYKSENKMDTMNLAIVFGPNVLRGNTQDRLRILQDSQKVMNIVNAMIVNTEILFDKSKEIEEEESYDEEEGEEEVEKEKEKEKEEEKNIEENIKEI